MISNHVKKPSNNYQLHPAMFSLVELDSHYIVAIDLPTIPSLSPEVFTSKGELTIEGQSIETHESQTVLRLLPKGKNIKTIYKDGIIWLLLPKFKVGALNMPTTTASI